MDTGGEREQRPPYRCWLAADRIAVARIAMSIEPLHQGVDFDRDFWRAHARRDLQKALNALMGAWRLVAGSACT